MPPKPNMALLSIITPIFCIVNALILECPFCYQNHERMTLQETVFHCNTLY